MATGRRIFAVREPVRAVPMQIIRARGEAQRITGKHQIYGIGIPSERVVSTMPRNNQGNLQNSGEVSMTPVKSSAEAKRPSPRITGGARIFQK
jgi:hypothetical protein